MIFFYYFNMKLCSLTPVLQRIEEDFDEMNLFRQQFCEDGGGAGKDNGSDASSSFRLSYSIQSSLGGAEGAAQSSLRGLLLDENF